ncbi:hypothetical protein HHI36_004967 [Cryptolaemus montrouzieri]|uniref:Uncharacterized protein n=1 Tax=Cryptolaemus montrouzieri TaxID=559131 RepID=A0ABD2NT18_9CUCU
MTDKSPNKNEKEELKRPGDDETCSNASSSEGSEDHCEILSESATVAEYVPSDSPKGPLRDSMSAENINTAANQSKPKTDSPHLRALLDKPPISTGIPISLQKESQITDSPALRAILNRAPLSEVASYQRPEALLPHLGTSRSFRETTSTSSSQTKLVSFLEKPSSSRIIPIASSGSALKSPAKPIPSSCPQTASPSSSQHEPAIIATTSTSPSKMPKKIDQRRNQTEFETGGNGISDADELEETNPQESPQALVPEDTLEIYSNMRELIDQVGHMQHTKEDDTEQITDQGPTPPPPAPPAPPIIATDSSNPTSGSSTPGVILEPAPMSISSNSSDNSDQATSAPSPPPPPEEAIMDMLEISPNTAESRRRKLSPSEDRPEANKRLKNYGEEKETERDSCTKNQDDDNVVERAEVEEASYSPQSEIDVEKLDENEEPQNSQGTVPSTNEDKELITSNSPAAMKR